MASTFPLVPKNTFGYDVTEVERFLADARRAYAGDSATAAAFASDKIRGTAFSMRKGGYATSDVDAALERLEDAFAAREREAFIARSGERAWFSEARELASEILARLERPEGQRFRRVSALTVGYHPKDVDAFAARLKGYFRDSQPLGPSDVRAVVFRAKRGGYREAQVDALLDGVVRVMLAVR